MSASGEIVVECDTKTCHAEVRYTATELWRQHVESWLHREGWKTPSDDTVICPQCVEEQAK